MKKRDFIFIGAILAVALIILAVSLLTQEDGAYVVVRADGKEVARYDLNKDGEYILNTGTNILKIENGEAWMIEANCPTLGDTRCTAKGKISKTREFVINLTTSDLVYATDWCGVKSGKQINKFEN